VHAMGSPPPAVRVLDLAHGAAHTHILGALARLRIADHVADQPRSVADLARATGAVPDRLDRLLRAATVLGLVQRTAAGMITMTEVGACLRTGPGSLRDFALMLSAPGQLRPLEHLSDAVRGEPAAEAALGQPLWGYYREHPDEGAAFAGAMSGVSAMIAGQVAAAAAVADSRRIVDVGGGHGTLLRALLATAPQAEGEVLDLPEVVTAAPAAERIQFTGGDFLTSVPAGGDVYVLCHVLHDWDDPDAQRILGTCRRAATRGQPAADRGGGAGRPARPGHAGTAGRAHDGDERRPGTQPRPIRPAAGRGWLAAGRGDPAAQRAESAQRPSPLTRRQHARP